MTSPPDVLVIGGGLHGCSAALQLAMRGARVTVIEKDHVGRHASGVNAGGVRRLARHPAEIPLAEASMRIWRDIADLVDDDCGFRVSGQKRVRCGQLVLTDAEITGVHVDGNNAAFVDTLDLRTYPPLVKFIAPAGSK